MRSFAPTLVLLAGIAVSSTVADAAPPDRRVFPRNTDVYLMENDLVYARFLALARNGTYRQINRDERGSLEVDQGRWEQEAGGALRLHSSCRALRPRVLMSGPLYVIIVDRAQIDGLPRLLASLRNFLREYADAVFDAGSVSDLCAADGPPVYVQSSHATFDRTDAVKLAANITDACECERDGTYVLKPVGDASDPPFTLPGGAFGEADLPFVRRFYGTTAAATALPFYFARIDAASYAREVGRWQPLHLPGSAE